jgi:hypothetical protein
MFLPKQLALFLITKLNKTWIIFKFCLAVWEELPVLHLHQPDRTAFPLIHTQFLIGIALTWRTFGIGIVVTGPGIARRSGRHNCMGHPPKLHEPLRPLAWHGGTDE